MPTSNMPQHIAIIMDGNGRWAKNHHQPRIVGHNTGARAVTKTVQYCVKNKIKVLTLFAFSTENWSRPKQEISLLMSLFIKVIQDEISLLNKNNVKMQVVGDVSKFPTKLQEAIKAAEHLTKNNQGLKLNIAANYGGRWDIVQACNRLLLETSKHSTPPAIIDENTMANYLALADVPDPDLLIRTGGETRISNFLLWQLAYAEFYFTNILWPDFDELELDKGIEYFKTRIRNFGNVTGQLPGG